MYKESMDAATIMFIGDTYCKAYNITYLNENYNLINNSLQSVRKIYYKCNSSRSSWINYKKALTKPENKNLSYVDRILNGLKNDVLSDEEFNNLPETEYTDYFGYKYIIGAKDGLENAASVKQIIPILESNISKTIEYDPDRKCRRLMVEFRTNIENAIITFNGLFEPFEYYESNEKSVILYYEENGLSFPKDNDGNYRTDWINIVPYKWKGMEIQSKNEHPVKRDGEWVVFENEITSNCLVIYNKMLYEYELNKFDDHYIKFVNIDIGNSNNFKLSDIEIIRLKSDDGLRIKQQKMIGFFNESDGTVYFPESIESSLITYNGIYQKYFIKPNKKSIKFRFPHDLVGFDDLEVENKSKIIATNFYTGSLPTNYVSFPKDDLASAANKMLDMYKNKLDNAESRITKLEKQKDLIYVEYNQAVEFKDIEDNTIKLKYIPIERTIRLLINNVEYDKDIYYSYNKDTKTIEWTFTEFNSGFDLKENMEINIVYDFYYSTNNLTGSDNVI